MRVIWRDAVQILGWGLLGMLLCLSTARAAVNAELSQNPVFIGDTFTLTISAEGGSGGEPDLAPLRRDFEVKGTGTSTRMSFVNGRMSSQLQWRVELMARRSGELTIPSLQVGDERTQAIPIKVSDAPLANDPKSVAAGEHVQIEMRVEAGGENPYVQQQVPVLVRLYLDDSVRRGKYSEPQIADAVVEKVGQERRYSTIRNGRNYRVIERRYAVFPQKSGELRIPPVRFEGEIRDKPKVQTDQRGQRPLRDKLFGDDPFFQDDFFASDPFDDFFDESSRPVRKFSSALTLQVRPPAVTQGNWLPASALRLRDSWADAPPQLKAGQPVTRTITVEAEGLTGAQIPAIELPAPAGVRIYQEPIANVTRQGPAGLVGESRQSVTYIPSNPGDLTLPETTVAWWDTGRDAAATASLPAWRLKVLPGDGGSARVPGANENTVPEAGGRGTTSPLSGSSAVPTQSWSERLSHWRWQLTGLALLLGLLALVAWLISRRGKSGAEAAAVMTPTPATTRVPASSAASAAVKPRETRPPAQEKSVLMRALEVACRDQDAEAAARALLALGRMHWPDDAPGNLEELAARLSAGKAQLHALDRVLYGPAGGSWPADQLWQALRHGLPLAQPPVDAAGGDGLPPLYPRQH